MKFIVKTLLRRPRLTAGTALFASALLFVSIMGAGKANALPMCSVGQRVIKPGGKLATVTAIQGSSCTVRADGENFTDVYAAFMLEAAPGATNLQNSVPRNTKLPNSVANTSGNRPNVGFYQCVSGSAGNLTLNILSGSRYSNAQGATGSYSITSSGKIQFNTGPWAGYFGRVLAGGRIGLTSTESSNFYQMTCDKRG